MDTAPEAAAETARNRSNLYGFLATAFRAEPTAALLVKIRDPVFREALGDVGVDLGTDPGERPDQALLDEWAQEFTRLFIGPGGHIPPYAAVHLGGDWASLWGPDTVWVKDFIENAGFRYRADYSDLPDHVSAELEFMREITAREAQAVNESDADEARELRRLQMEFLTQHMMRWIPEFCRKVETMAERPFYKGIAALTREFIVSEAKALPFQGTGQTLQSAEF